MKATLYVASSLNGLMTNGPTNSSWVSGGDEVLFAETCKEVGCILVGRQTFDQYQGVVYPVPGAKNIVLTAQDRTSEREDVFFEKNLQKAFERIDALGFKRFVVVGGAKVIEQCLNQRLIDKFYISLHPYLFKEGLSIVGGYRGDIDLEFVGIKHQHHEFTLLEYNVKNYKDKE